MFKVVLNQKEQKFITTYKHDRTDDNKSQNREGKNIVADISIDNANMNDNINNIKLDKTLIDIKEGMGEKGLKLSKDAENRKEKITILLGKKRKRLEKNVQREIAQKTQKLSQEIEDMKIKIQYIKSDIQKLQSEQRNLEIAVKQLENEQKKLKSEEKKKIEEVNQGITYEQQNFFSIIEEEEELKNIFGNAK